MAMDRAQYNKKAVLNLLNQHSWSSALEHNVTKTLLILDEKAQLDDDDKAAQRKEIHDAIVFCLYIYAECETFADFFVDNMQKKFITIKDFSKAEQEKIGATFAFAALAMIRLWHDLLPKIDTFFRNQLIAKLKLKPMDAKKIQKNYSYLNKAQRIFFHNPQKQAICLKLKKDLLDTPIHGGNGGVRVSHLFFPPTTAKQGQLILRQKSTYSGGNDTVATNVAATI